MLSGTPSRDFAACFAAGELVVGVDEAGRGPLAGPVVAAAVVLCKPRPAGLDDSKKLTAKVRVVSRVHLEQVLMQSYDQYASSLPSRDR